STSFALYIFLLCAHTAPTEIYTLSLHDALPIWDSPSTSVRQFIEFAVNIPEQEPQVGQAFSSTSASWASVIESSALSAIASTRSMRCSVTPSIGLPDSEGPPETKMTGMFSRIAAIRWPGVILSQLEMHTSASAVWALTMYSIESAMMSRLGSEYS